MGASVPGPSHSPGPPEPAPAEEPGSDSAIEAGIARW
jgi:hypothetical protein